VQAARRGGETALLGNLDQRPELIRIQASHTKELLIISIRTISLTHYTVRRNMMAHHQIQRDVYATSADGSKVCITPGSRPALESRRRMARRPSRLLGRPLASGSR
jgi:hypothetical protein